MTGRTTAIWLSFLLCVGLVAGSIVDPSVPPVLAAVAGICFGVTLGFSLFAPEAER